MRPSLPMSMVLIALLMGGCEQQQPITQKTPPPAGFKDGETPPVEPDRVRPAVDRPRDAEPLAPATAPALPNDPNHAHPSAPLPPPTSTPPPGPVTPVPERHENEPATTIAPSRTATENRTD